MWKLRREMEVNSKKQNKTNNFKACFSQFMKKYKIVSKLCLDSIYSCQDFGK